MKLIYEFAANFMLYMYNMKFLFNKIHCILAVHTCPENNNSIVFYDTISPM